MKQVLVGAVLLITAAIGISAPPQVAAEHAESPAGAAREVATRLANGHSNACIVLDNEQVRCWGNSSGTGVPGSGNIGDDETPDSVRTVDVGPGRTVQAVENGENFTCVLLDNGDVRCWGYQTFGPMLGSPESAGARIGDNEEPTTIAPISLGGKATAIAAGNFSSCAILEDGSVRCWGDNRFGQLGYGNTNDVGDDETPAQAGAVALGAGRTATAITVGRYHACAILDNGDMRCWGKADSMPGLVENIGDDELPSAAPVVDFGGKRALAVSAGDGSTCALIEGGEVWCWGVGDTARYSTGESRFLDSPEAMDLGGRVAASITVGFDHGCIVFDDATMACWGESGAGGVNDGRLGYPNLQSLGNNDLELGNGTLATPESPLLGGDVNVGAGRTVLTASAGNTTTCALLDNLTVRCWGSGPIVGQGIPIVVGDNEEPGDVPVINYNGTAAFTPVSPARLLDTRAGQPAPVGSPKGIVSPGGAVDVQVTGAGGVPETGVYAVVLNVTIAQSTRRGFVTAFPKGATQPTASNINVTGAFQNAPNSVIVPVGDDGKVTIFTSGGGHLLADVFGYFEQTGSATAGRLIGVSPSRIFDTRPDKPEPGPKGKVPAGGTIEIGVTGTNGVPATGVSAIVLNVTAANATARGFITVFPGDEDRPETSNLNLSKPGESRPNTVIVPVSPTGTVKMYSKSGAHLLADVSGYFTDDTAPDTDDGLFVPLVPARLLDSRDAGAPIVPGGTTSFAVTGELGIPNTANAVVLNLTAVRSTARGFVTGWPSDETQPGSSNLNVSGPNENIANLAVLPLRLPSGRISLFTLGGSHLLADTSGYFL